MSRWFRHYAGMMRDDKLVRAAMRSKQSVERVTWVWGAILESAAEINDAGRYELDAAEVAYFLRADEADIAAIETALSDLGRVADGVVVKWGDRQFQSDKSATRQAAYRERKRQGDSGNNDSDGGVTVKKRHSDVTVTPHRHRHRQIQNTETEKKERTDSGAVATATPPDSGKIFDDQFWFAYPRRDGANPKAPARKAFIVAVKNGNSPASIIAGASRYAADLAKSNKVGTPYVAQAVTWLHQRRWEDYPDEIEPTTGPPKPPNPALPSHEELLRRYGGSNADDGEGSGQGSPIRKAGDGVHPEDVAIRPQVAPNYQAEHQRMASVGEIFPGSAGFLSVGDVACDARPPDGERRSGDDGPSPMAGVVRH